MSRSYRSPFFMDYNCLSVRTVNRWFSIPDKYFLVRTAGDPAANSFFVRPVADLTTDQKEKEQTENKIETDKTNQREDSVAVTHDFAVAVARPKEAVDQPGLPAQFGRHPPQCVGDVRKGKRQHQYPQQRGAGFQSAAAILESGKGHQDDENRAQRDHQVKRVVQQLDVVGPLILWVFLKPLHVTSKMAVGEKTES